MIRKTILLPLFILVLLAACQGKHPASSSHSNGTLTPLLYAQGFSIAHAAHYTTITVYNPWKPGEVYDIYYLVKDATTKTPQGGNKVIIPLKSLMSNSSTHLGFLELLGEIHKVTGVCNADYIYNTTILQGIKEGRVKDVGEAFDLDIENLLLLHPQAVMTTAYNVDDENSKRMKQTGLTLLYNIEWQEKSLLARAEWIKFVAAFFDKEALADSIFVQIDKQYREMKSKAKAVTHIPSVVSGQDYRGSWSMPGGRSFSAELFRDAGVSYYYAADTTSGSISNSIEEALVHFNGADLWLGAEAFSLEELGKTDSKYKLFNAYKKGKVYNNNKRTNQASGNDYWESGVARPDLLLADIIKIAHPLLLPAYELTYLQQLTPNE